MKTTVRMDAHLPWLPRFGIVKMLPNPLDKAPEVVPVSTGTPVDGGHQSEAIQCFIDGQARVTAKQAAKPHPWPERRADVIEQFSERIIEHRTPRGFTDAWRPDDHDVATTELAWLIANQDKELPPEWLTMRSNGVRGESLDALVDTEDGQYSQADLLPDGAYDLAASIHTYELVGGMRQIEAFLEESDRQKWFSGRVRRYAGVVNAEGKRGVVPMSRATTDKTLMEDWETLKAHLPSVEAMEIAEAWRESHTEMYRDDQGRQRRRYIEGTFGSREDGNGERGHYTDLEAIENERDLTEYRVPEQEDGYKPSTPCPNPKCEERGDDCRVCFGSAYILHTLGMDVHMDSTYASWREELRNIHSGNRRIRDIIDRLDADLAALKRRK